MTLLNQCTLKVNLALRSKWFTAEPGPARAILPDLDPDPELQS